MGQMIQLNNELIRICPNNKQKIEYSRNNGITWIIRYAGASCGDFNDIIDDGKEIIGMTSKGVYYSRNQGITWIKRS
jgi:hypothetical protein